MKRRFSRKRVSYNGTQGDGKKKTPKDSMSPTSSAKETEPTKNNRETFIITRVSLTCTPTHRERFRERQRARESAKERREREEKKRS